jgi:sigma-B regulation protein RsbU (phosphoserine phosphatase)
MRKGASGAWIIGVGILFVAVAAVREVLLVIGINFSQILIVLADQAIAFGFILSIAAYLARDFALANKNLLKREQEKAKVEQELALAAEIQRGLFPEKLPSINGYEVAARNRPALVCGGDYYDVIAINGASGNDDGQKSYMLCVADVAGKGLDASLLMSNMQATLRALVHHVSSLVELAAQINERLYAASPPNKFVTAILLEIDPATGEGEYINAGHNQCILLSDAEGKIELLESTGLPFGIMPDDTLRMLGKQYEQKAFQLHAGDLLALYSDGVPEAYNEREQEWGETKLRECLHTVVSQSAETIVNRVFSEIDEFAGTAPQHDDITLLVIKRALP